MTFIPTVNPTTFYLLSVLITIVSTSPLQETRSSKNYLLDNHDDADELVRRHHELTRPEPITSHHHGGHQNFMVPSGYGHHALAPVAEDVHHRPSISSYYERPSLTLPPERPSQSSLVHSHFSSVLGPMVRNIVSNVLINIAHGVSTGIMTGLTAGRPPLYHGIYPPPYHYRPYLDAHKSSEVFNHPYDKMENEMEYINNPSFILEHPLTENDKNKKITSMMQSERPVIKIVKAMIKENRESPLDSQEKLQSISS